MNPVPSPHRLARAACRGLAAGLLLAALLASAPAMAQWRMAQSDNFTLYSEGHEDSLREQIENLERLRWTGLRLMGADDQRLRVRPRLELVVARGEVGLKALRPDLREDVSGVYTLCDEGAVIYAIDSGHRRDNDISWGQAVLQHELAHHLTYQAASTALPAWYVEGLAEYLQVTHMDAGALVVGGRNRFRSMALERGKGLPLNELLDPAYTRQAQRPASEMQTFYAQSWLLVHFLLDDSTRAAGLARYLERLAAGDDPVKAFEPATGLSLAALPQQLDSHHMRLRELRIRGADLPKVDVSVRTLGDDESQALPDALRLRSCVAARERQALLARLRPLAAQAGPAVRRTLAWAELLEGQTEAAIALVRPLADANEQDAEAHTLLGRAIAQQAKALKDEERQAELEAARAHLFQAYRVRKNDPVLLAHLAETLVALRGDTDPNAVNAARAARAMAPAVPRFAMLDASLSLAAGDTERAIRALGPLASNPHDQTFGARVRAAIAALRAGEGIEGYTRAMSAPAATKTAP